MNQQKIKNVQCGWGNFALFLHCSYFCTWWTRTLKFSLELVLLNLNLAYNFSSDQLSRYKMTNVNRQVPTFSLSSLPAISIGFFCLKGCSSQTVRDIFMKIFKNFHECLILKSAKYKCITMKTSSRCASSIRWSPAPWGATSRSWARRPSTTPRLGKLL